MIPFWPVNDLNDVNTFYTALDKLLLADITTTTAPNDSLSIMSNNSQHTAIV